MNKVTVVAHPETNKVLTVREDGWGKFRVDSVQRVIENGIFRKTKRTAFISVDPENVEHFDLEAGEKLSGIIQKQKSNAPFWEGQDKAINPKSGDTMDYYLNFEYLSDSNAPSAIEVSNQEEVVEEQTDVNATA